MVNHSVQPHSHSNTDLELLSAYLDDQLDNTIRTNLEQRLSTDAQLHSELAELRATTQLLRTLTPVEAPRSFALNPEDVSVQPRFWMRLQRFSPIAAVLILGLMISGVFALSQMTLIAGNSPEVARMEPEAALPAPALSNETDTTLSDTAGSGMSAAEESARNSAAQEEAAESGAAIQNALPTEDTSDAKIQIEGETNQAATRTGQATTPSPVLSPEPSVSLPPRIAWLTYVLIGAITIALLLAGLWFILRRRM